MAQMAKYSLCHEAEQDGNSWTLIWYQASLLIAFRNYFFIISDLV